MGYSDCPHEDVRMSVRTDLVNVIEKKLVIYCKQSPSPLDLLSPRSPLNAGTSPLIVISIRLGNIAH